MFSIVDIHDELFKASVPFLSNMKVSTDRTDTIDYSAQQASTTLCNGTDILPDQRCVPECFQPSAHASNTDATVNVMEFPAPNTNDASFGVVRDNSYGTDVKNDQEHIASVQTTRRLDDATESTKLFARSEVLSDLKTGSSRTLPT